jgi:hypothetical protein
LIDVPFKGASAAQIVRQCNILHAVLMTKEKNVE